MTLQEQINQLRKEGKSYSEITELLHCSKGTVAYHCNQSVKKNTMKRQRQWRNENTLKVKIRNFNHPTGSKRKKYGDSNIRNPKLTEKDLLEKFGNSPKCYLTGVVINLDDPSAYSLDHIIPISRGGTNDISNCGLVSKKANLLKNDLTYDELIQFCKLILKNHTENGTPGGI